MLLGVITLIRNSGDRLMVWDFIFAAKGSCPELRMAQVASPELIKMSKHCSRRASVLLQSTLYSTVKLNFQIDGSGIVKDGRIKSDIGSGSLGQSAGALSPTENVGMFECKMLERSE